LSYRVVKDDGGYAVHIVTIQQTKVVPGFPTAEQAQEWITLELKNRPKDGGK
jgi:hypothetical protein